MTKAAMTAGQRKLVLASHCAREQSLSFVALLPQNQHLTIIMMGVKDRLKKWLGKMSRFCIIVAAVTLPGNQEKKLVGSWKKAHFSLISRQMRQQQASSLLSRK